MSRRAFTLVELVVVIVILAVVAGVAAPRLLGSRGRAAQNEAREVAALLSVAAHRSALGGGRLAVEYSGGDRALTLLRLGSAEEGWVPDSLSTPVRLANARIAAAAADGAALPSGGWRVEFPTNDRRPDLLLIVQSATGVRPARVWTVGLPSFAAAAGIEEGDRPASGWPVSFDLDAEGVGDQRW